MDHQERRRLIAQATWRVIIRDGTEAASVRTVAAEAGGATGALRHDFADQGSLLLFAAHLTVERIVDRMDRQLADLDRPPLDVVQGCLEELLPLDAERTAETTVYFGLIDLTRLVPGHQEFRTWSFEETRRMVRCFVVWLAGGAAPPADLLMRRDTVGAEPLQDPGLEERAVALQVLVDGLAVQGLLYPQLMDSPTVRAVLRAELERVPVSATGG